MLQEVRELKDKYERVKELSNTYFAIRIVRDYLSNLLPNLVTALRDLTLPKSFASNSDWSLFSKNVYKTVLGLDTFDGEYSLHLAEEQNKQIEKYIKSSIFFMECLQQANVPNYQALIDNLFLV